MFFKEVKKPKVGQTIFMVGKTKNESGKSKTYFRQLYIKKVITTALTETPMSLIMDDTSFDVEMQQYFQNTTAVKEMKNHILIETRCGEIIDLTVGERCGEKNGEEPLGEIFFNRKQAKKYFIKEKKGFFPFDEAHELLSCPALNELVYNSVMMLR